MQCPPGGNKKCPPGGNKNCLASLAWAAWGQKSKLVPHMSTTVIEFLAGSSWKICYIPPVEPAIKRTLPTD